MTEMNGLTNMIPGVTLTGQMPSEALHILIPGLEKTGKSCLITSLVNWPKMGDQPLVIAWDPSGPESCKSLGYDVYNAKVRDLPGDTYWAKALGLLTTLEQAKRAGKFPFTSIVVDCASTMSDKLWIEDTKIHPSKHPKVNYGNILNQGREFMHRLIDLNIPTVWLSWLQEPYVDENKRQVLGRPSILGSFRAVLAGRVNCILPLEKRRVGVGQPGADPEGYVRLLHSRTWAMIEAGGRFSYKLPEPCPAHLGYVFDLLMDRVKPMTSARPETSTGNAPVQSLHPT